MSDHQYEKISILMDGEVDSSSDEIINEITGNSTLVDKWWRYHVISDVLRGEKNSLTDRSLCDRISAAVADDPVVFSPSALKLDKKQLSWRKSVAGVAIAASVALVAIFSVQQGDEVVDSSAIQPLAQLPTNTQPAPPHVSSIPVQLANSQGRNAIMEVTPVNSSRLNSYMVNYNEFRTSGTTIQGMLPYVRVIANDVEDEQD